MNLARPNKNIKYLSDSNKVWVIYSPHTGWEHTIMAEINMANSKVISVIDGERMENRELIMDIDIIKRPRKLDIDGKDLGLIMKAYLALRELSESHPDYELAQALIFHCDSNNIIYNPTGLSSDFVDSLDGNEIADLLDIFRRVNLKRVPQNECICGICCDLDNRVIELEKEGLLDADGHGVAIGIVCNGYADGLNAIEVLQERGYRIVPDGKYTDKHRNFIVYVLRG